MTPFVAELTGTALLILLGNGVVANVVLPQTKGQGGGWIVITFGWAMAVFVGVYATGSFSGAHLNPAVTLALAIKSGDYSLLPVYIPAQLLGAMLGAKLVWFFYRNHFIPGTDTGTMQAVFFTAPAIANPFQNFVAECLGTFVLIIGILLMTKGDVKLGPLDALPVSLLVLAIGLSLGGTTGYAINPARDLGPRIIYSLLPIPGKTQQHWSYAWIPVLAPLTGAALAVLVLHLIL